MKCLQTKLVSLQLGYRKTSMYLHGLALEGGAMGALLSWLSLIKHAKYLDKSRFKAL